MRVNLVHDKVMQFGGAERVVRHMREVWPDAALYTSVYDPDLVEAEHLGEVHASAMQRLPGVQHRHRWLLPAYPVVFERLEIADCDAVVSSSAMFAKSVRAPEGAVHVCYCHTPVRYLWDLADSHVDELDYPAPIRMGVRALIPYLRRMDLRAAKRVDRFVANSTHVRARIERFYGRDSTVVHPPVDVARYTKSHEKGDYFLVAARLFPYKRVDMAIEACRRAGVPVKVMGDGPDRARLESLGYANAQFLGWVSENEKPALFGSARALLAPQIEDFGIVMVEALAAGTPVIAIADGGAIDIVEDGVTGRLINDITAESLSETLVAFDDAAFETDGLRARAADFSPERFSSRIRDVVQMAIETGPAS